MTDFKKYIKEQDLNEKKDSKKEQEIKDKEKDIPPNGKFDQPMVDRDDSEKLSKLIKDGKLKIKN